MEKLNLDKGSLRKFGITMGIAFLAISSIIFFRHRHSFLPEVVISGLFFAFAFLAPLLLKPVYIVWMRFAFLLGWVNTRLILAVLFYLVFTPIGLVLKMLNNDLLDRKIEKDKGSYWREKEIKPYSQGDYERQF